MKLPTASHDHALVPAHPHAPAVALEITTGASAGAALGLSAGPPGVIAGALVGGAVGALAAAMIEQDEEERRRHEAALDEAIGVVGGHVGEASPDAPPPVIGAFGAASMGVGGAGEIDESDGPIQALDDG